MFNLILAIISSSLVSIVMRIGEDKAKNNISMLSVNYFICMMLSFIYTGVGNLFQTGEGLGTALGLGTINGFFYILSLVLFQSSVKKNGVVLSSIFMKLGIMMPLVISIVMFKEKPSVMQILGFAIAVAAIILINLKETSTEDTLGKAEASAIMQEKICETAKQKTVKKNSAKLGLIFVLLGCGTADGMSKIYQELGTDQFEELFLVLTFVIAFVLSIIFVKMKKQCFTKNELLYGAMLGVPNYFSARFLLKALGQVPAVVAYPTFSIGTIAVITLIGMLIFKEKLTKLQGVAIVLIAAAVILLN